MNLSGYNKSISEKVSRQLQNLSKWEKLENTTCEGNDFLVGQEKDNLTPRYFYPVSSKDKFTFKTLKTVIESSKQDSLTLAIQDADSTTVFYETRIGLNPPPIKDSSSDP